MYDMGVYALNAARYSDGVLGTLNVNVSRAKDICSADTSAPTKRLITLLSIPQVIGLTKPSGGGGV